MGLFSPTDEVSVITTYDSLASCAQQQQQQLVNHCQASSFIAALDHTHLCLHAF